MKNSNPYGSFNEPTNTPACTRWCVHPKFLRSAGLFFLVLALLAVSPVMAGTKFMTGSPDLSASIAGTNEFSPGDDVNLQVVIGNTGLNQYKIIQSGIIDPSDLSSTAKQTDRCPRGVRYPDRHQSRPPGRWRSPGKHHRHRDVPYQGQPGRPGRDLPGPGRPELHVPVPGRAGRHRYA